VVPLFKFLKDKLKGTLSKFSKDVDEASEDAKEEDTKKYEEEIEEHEKKHEPEKKSIFAKIKESLTKKKEDKAEEWKKEPSKEEPVRSKAPEFVTPEEEEKEESKEAVEESIAEEEEIRGIEEEEKKEEEIREELKEDEAFIEKEEEKGLGVVEEKEEAPKEEKPEPVKEEPPEDEEPPKEEIPEEEAEKPKPLEPVPAEEVKEEKAPEEKKKEVARKEPEKEPPEEKKSFFGKIADRVMKKSISEKKFNDLFWDIEVALLENNVAVEVIEKIKSDLKEELVNKPVRIGKTNEVIESTLVNSIKSLFDTERIDIIKNAKQKKPYVICFFGVNGAGKTTTIAKIVRLLQKNNVSSVIAASDTFRAASLEQLDEHAKKLDVKVIKHDYGADPAAVAFDAIQHAKSKNKDVVLIDTAGRQHSNTNLMSELKKVVKVSNPDLKIFVGDSLTGNDAVEQAKKFNEAVGIDAVVLTKMDVDEKGGAAISVSYVTKKPIIFWGCGQEYDDLKEFNEGVVVESLGLEA